MPPNDPHSGDDTHRAELVKLSERFGYRFQKPELLEQAFVHASMGNEGKRSNERLEFLGDAVLQLVVSDRLFRDFPKDDEGQLTSRRKRFVSRGPLARVCRELGLIDFLEYGRGLTSQELDSERLQANLVEALLGAIWLDGGKQAAETFIRTRIFELIGLRSAKPALERDPKTQLLHYCQAHALGQPKYRLIGQSGPDHAIEFESAVFVQDEELATGTGPAKQLSERTAAEQALQILRSRDEMES